MAPTHRTQPGKKKKLVGGIVKETNSKLSAIEKRRRMVEAGRKFSKLNGLPVHSYNKEQLMGLVHGCEPTFSSAIPVPVSQQKIIPANAGASDSRNCTQDVDRREIKHVKKLPPPVRLLQPLRPPQSTSKMNLGASGDTDSVNILFEKDAKSLLDIINHKPIAHIIGRPSYARQRERLSLFPNGINPMDVAVKNHATTAAFMSPRISSIDSSELQPLSTPAGASSSCTPQNSGLRSSCRKTPKSVRFNDMIAFRSPSVTSLETPQACGMINVEVDDEELVAQLCKLPLITIKRLQNSLDRITSESVGENVKLMLDEPNQSGEGNAKQLFRMNSDAPKRGTRSRNMADRNAFSDRKLSMVTEENESNIRMTRMNTRSTGLRELPECLLPPKCPQRGRRSRKNYWFASMI